MESDVYALNVLVAFTFCISALIGYIIVPRIVFISKKKGLFDYIDKRKVHTTPVPRLGGVSFFPALIFSVALTMTIRDLLKFGIPEYLSANISLEMPALLCGLVVLYFTGMADDLVGVNYKYKLIAQFIASSLLIIAGVYIKSFHGFLGQYEVPIWIGIPLTIVLVTFVINAINLIDGIDGLASGLSSIALSALGIWFFYHQLYIYAMIAFAMLGVLIPFFIFNVFGHKHKIFMGDTGSLLIGFLIAFLGCKLCDLSANYPIFYMKNAPIFIFSILFIPLFDAARVFIERMHQGKSPFEPDKSHIHHKFLALGYSHRRTMVIILSIAALVILINYILGHFININIMFFIDITLGLIMVFILRRIQIMQESENGDDIAQTAESITEFEKIN